VAVSADGLSALSASRDQTLKLWNLQTGLEKRTFRSHLSWVRDVAFRRDGRLAISACWERTVKAWDLNAEAAIATFTCDWAALCCALADTGKIVVGDTSGACIFSRSSSISTATFRPSKELKQRLAIWRPSGNGPFPAILWNHGSEKRPGSQPALAKFYTQNSYVFFVPHRRGQGRSPGDYIQELIATRAFELYQRLGFEVCSEDEMYLQMKLDA
jgi:WD40 repeat protein